MNFTHRILRVVHVGLVCLFTLSACIATPATPTPAPQEAAINSIRAILELPILPVTYVETLSMANSPDGSLRVERYDDSEGRKFYVEPLTNQVVEVDARSKLSPRPTPGPTLTPNELNEKADKIAKAVIPDYGTAINVLSYEENNKGDENYFYDWRDMSQPVVHMPPFVQIALYKSGELFGYINTLSVK
jgi:hypothetical protein